MPSKKSKIKENQSPCAITYGRMHLFVNFKSQHLTNRTNTKRDIYTYQRLLQTPAGISEIINERFMQTKSPVTILDSGCGYGVAINQLLNRKDLRDRLKLAIGISKDYFSPLKGVMTAHHQRFKFYLGTTQDVLKSESIKADYIFDVWGAYTYSPDKLALLRLFYQSLKPGGVAYIYTPMSASLSVHNGIEGMSLYDYLESNFPEHFECKAKKGTSDTYVLIMHKTSERFPVPHHELVSFDKTPSFRQKASHPISHDKLEAGNALAADNVHIHIPEEQPMKLRLKPYS